MTNDELKAIRVLQRLSQELSDVLYSETSPARSFEAADEELAAMGVDVGSLAEEQTDIKPVKAIVERLGEAVEQIAVEIKVLLNEVTKEPLTAEHFGNGVAASEGAMVRVIPLCECAALQQRLPWLGACLRIYQRDRDVNGDFARYVACVDVVEVGPGGQAGKLRVILAAKDGGRGEVRLSYDYPSGCFPVQLPADESQVALECHAEVVE